jgi:hypothetical protein
MKTKVMDSGCVGGCSRERWYWRQRLPKLSPNQVSVGRSWSMPALGVGGVKSFDEDQREGTRW